MKKKIVPAIIMGTVMLALTASAMQGPRGSGKRERRGPFGGSEQRWAYVLKNPKLAEKVGLTEADIAALEQIQYRQQKEGIALQAAVQLAHLEQKQLMDQSEVDEAAVMAALEKTSAATLELRKSQIRGLLEVKKVLGEEKIKALREEGRKAARKKHSQRGKKNSEGHRKGRRGSDRSDQNSIDDIPEAME